MFSSFDRLEGVSSSTICYA